MNEEHINSNIENTLTKPASNTNSNSNSNVGVTYAQSHENECENTLNLKLLEHRDELRRNLNKEKKTVDDMHRPERLGPFSSGLNAFASDTGTVSKFGESVMQEFRHTIPESSESEAGFKMQNNLINHDAEEYIKDEIKQAFDFQNKANKQFKKNNYQLALEDYKKALDKLNIDRKCSDFLNFPNFNIIRIKCMSNIAICYYMLKDYSEVIKITDEILEIQSQNFDAFFIRSKAFKQLEKYQEALQAVRSALTIKSNKNLLKEQKELEKKLTKKDSGNEEEEKASSDHQNVSNRPSTNILIKLFTIITFWIWDYIKKNKLFLLIVAGIIIYAIRKRFQNKIASLLNFIFFNR